MAEAIIETFQIPRKKKFAKKAKKAGFILSIITYPLILFAVFYVYVNINSILMAFQQIKLDGTITWVGFQNFVEFWNQMFASEDSRAEVGIAFINSFKIYGISLVICMPLYILFSYLLYKKCLLHKTFRALSMLPQIISGFVVCMLFVNFINGSDAPMYVIQEKLGIFLDENGRPAELLYSQKYALGTTIFYGIWLSFGTNLIVYPNAMKEINPEVVESSRLDGVTTSFQDLWHIVLPLIFPTISTFLITGLAAIFSNGGSVMAFYERNAPTHVLNMGYLYSRMILNNETTAYPTLAAGGLIMTAFVAPATLLLRWFLEKFGPTTEA